jgi:hypothetical protein
MRKKGIRGGQLKSLTPGARFGWLVIIGDGGVAQLPSKQSPSGTRRSSTSVCKCLCGNVITVENRYLRSLNVKSCGCRQRVVASESLKKMHANGEWREKMGLERSSRGHYLPKKTEILPGDSVPQ